MRRVDPDYAAHKIFKYIIVHHAKHNVSPTFAEIADGTRLTVNMVWRTVRRLIAEGYLSQQDGNARSLTVVRALPPYQAKVLSFEERV